jgi:tRNA threonylcarbamoyl adenosine modification protein YeaZ
MISEKIFKKNEKYLILDISIKTQLIILTTKEKIIDIIKYSSGNKFVENMIPLIEEIIKKNNIEIEKLNGIIVGIGPGSFIGVRISVLTSKILSLGLKIPLYKISSLILLSSGYIDNNILTPKIYAYQNFFYSISLNQKKILLKESIYNKSFLEKYNNHLLLEEKNIKISLEKVFFYMKKVIDPHSLIPSYYDIY